MKLRVIIVLGLLGAMLADAHSAIEIYPASTRAVASPIYHVRVDGRPVFTEVFTDVHYAHFSASGRVSVSIAVAAPIESFSIQPRFGAPVAEIKGRTLEFTVEPPRQLVVTINGAQRLFVFVDPIDRQAPRLGGDPAVHSILDFGVDPTGTRIETRRIQDAIDRVAAAGGVLYFPPGTYLTGTLALKSNLTFYLAGGATLLGSGDRDDYPVDAGFTESDAKNAPRRWSNKGADMTYSRLVLLDHARNVRLAGRGVIDGQGRRIRNQGKPANLLRIRDSSHVTVEGLILRDAAAWNTHVLYSSDVTIRDVKIVNDRDVANSDGIDPDSAQDVLIERCFLYTGDDAFALKTSGNSRLLRDAEHITIRDCTILTKKSAMKLGTETFAAFERDILFENNDLIEADRAMSLYSADGATFENIRWVGNRIENTYPDSQRRTLLFSVKRRGGKTAGSIRNVLIQDTQVAHASPNPLLMEGWDATHDIRGVRFVNFRVGDRVCTDAASARLETNRFVHDITFASGVRAAASGAGP